MAKKTTIEVNYGEFQNMAETMKAMAHSDRLIILKVLCKEKSEGLTVKTIYETLGLQQPVVSRHLQILKNAGVLRRLQEGQKTSYRICINNKKIESLLKCFC